MKGWLGPKVQERRRVNVYIDEIVPHLSVLSYNKVGYNKL